MFIIDISTEGNTDAYPLEALRQCIKSTLQQLTEWNPNDATEVSVLLTDNELISQLNAEWRGKEGPTDVLSFPGIFEDEYDEYEIIFDNDDEESDIDYEELEIPSSLGDIVISLEYAEQVVQERKHIDRIASVMEEAVTDRSINSTQRVILEQALESWTLIDEVQFLVIHSFFHLLGWDDESEEEDLEMRRLEFTHWARLRTSSHH